MTGGTINKKNDRLNFSTGLSNFSVLRSSVSPFPSYINGRRFFGTSSHLQLNNKSESFFNNGFTRLLLLIRTKLAGLFFALALFLGILILAYSVHTRIESFSSEGASSQYFYYELLK
jgi:hypothetical protein